MKSNFQIILLSVFGFFLILAVLIFAGVIHLGSSSGTTAAGGTVVVWGTAPYTSLSGVLGQITSSNQSLHVSYIQKNAATFDADLINALASGTGPDVFFLTTDAILRNKDKIFPIPYTSLPQATFDASYVTEGDMYLDSEGVLGVPLTLDPLVLYYNAGLLDAAGIARVPQYWDEVLQAAPVLTVKDNAGNITQSAIALGQYDNINEAKNILALLMMQSGGQLVGRNADGTYGSALKLQPAGALVNPANEALQFFTEFTDPLKSAYSWNKSLPNAEDMFTSGRLALYIGRASELFTIQSKNPNLNFNVAPIPQIRGNATKLTYGAMTALAISKTSKNLAGSVTLVSLMTGTDASKIIMTALALSPVRRDIIAAKPATTDPAYAKVFYDAALIARGWLDPDRAGTNAIFREMINNVLSGADQAGTAIGTASDELDLLLGKI